MSLEEKEEKPEEKEEPIEEKPGASDVSHVLPIDEEKREESAEERPAEKKPWWKFW